jgi:hypothetical protein
VARVADAGTKDKGTRTTAQIEADIAKTRDRLATTLDELAVAVHPSTVAAQAKAKLVGTMEQKAAKAYVAASGAVERVKAQFTDESGQPRMERIVPAALVGVGVLLLLSSARKRTKD